ncbi:MAG: hypothetical protein AABW89_03810 [Nanoarchaeota archaeon]
MFEIGDLNERRNRAEQLGNKLGSMIRVVHQYKGSFSSRPVAVDPRGRFPILSSVSNNNVSFGGAICDLDTLSFNLGENALELQRADYDRGFRTCLDFANLLDDGVNYLSSIAERAFNEAYNSPHI